MVGIKKDTRPFKHFAAFIDRDQFGNLASHHSLFRSTSQEIGWEEHLQNDLLCIE